LRRRQSGGLATPFLARDDLEPLVFDKRQPPDRRQPPLRRLCTGAGDDQKDAADDHEPDRNRCPDQHSSAQGEKVGTAGAKKVTAAP
jgi:hypothetical protein